MYLPSRQTTPASSLWLQSCDPIKLWEQEKMDTSLPVQWTLSNNIEPFPWPKEALPLAIAPEIKYNYIIYGVYTYHN